MLAKSIKKNDYSGTNLTESRLRLKKQKKVSALGRLSSEDLEFILSSDIPEVSGARNKFLVYPDTDAS